MQRTDPTHIDLVHMAGRTEPLHIRPAVDRDASWPNTLLAITALLLTAGGCYLILTALQYIAP